MEFFDAVMKSQPQMLNDWKAEAVVPVLLTVSFCHLISTTSSAQGSMQQLVGCA